MSRHLTESMVPDLRCGSNLDICAIAAQRSKRQLTGKRRGRQSTQGRQEGLHPKGQGDRGVQLGVINNHGNISHEE